MKKILINFAHPSISKSHVNKAMLTEINLLPAEVKSFIKINDLYDRYPDFHINVVREKKLLLNHDIILFHHPFHWYSSPAIIKEWQDNVLEYGFAYGPEGDALKGKVTQNIITTGGPEESYNKSSYNHYTVEELLRPFEQTANLCQMQYLPPYCVYDAGRLTNEQISDVAKQYTKHLLQLITGK